jgi:hypothetical protein
VLGHDLSLKWQNGGGTLLALPRLDRRTILRPRSPVKEKGRPEAAFSIFCVSG